ncbi:hypothetical protein GCM10027034_33190 [Ramlibacter solisilvae]|uniref:DUF3108 domain-containing protein n=1 Tax=Ramlibacter tataouinensis TaxID=94132 RepID=A0A127JS69_9BURK|nr:DUF3108 domain-containing protein [Ramlibacter tataouinensis]AMO22838.1 hypothetical protein UC35_07960 [Ramlibacter tataouinensis]
MAERTQLRVRRPFRFAALVALVILVHSLALDRLSDALEEPALLKQMATPMFTRVLQPQEPPPVAAAPAPEAPPPPRRAAVTSVAKKAAPKPAKPASKPASAAAPEEVASAAAPADVASAPAEPASDAAVAQQQAASAPGQGESMAKAPESAASAPAAPPHFDSWPADTRLSYRLSGLFRGGELYGSARVQWQREEDRYQNRVDIDVPPFAWFILTSQGDVTPQGLSPRAYQEQRRSSTRSVQLNADDVVLNDGRRVPRPPSIQDAASQFVELAHRFAMGQEKLEVGHHIEFWLARPNGVDLWTYDIVDRQALELRGMGVVEAFHLKPRRITNPRGNFTAEIWFAPALQYLPVRIRVNMGTEAFVELTAEKIEQR